MKMGSGASSVAKSIEKNNTELEIQCIESSSETNTAVRRLPAGNGGHRRIKISPHDHHQNVETENTAPDKCLSKDVMEFEKQMAELEGQNLDLQDQVALLEQQLESFQKVSTDNTEWMSTLAAKEEYTEFLETQAQDTQAEMTMMKKKLRRKLRRINTQLSEAKQEHSVQSFEHQQQIQKLREENETLKNQLLSGHAGEMVHDYSENKTKIILELSARVSEQDQKITDLERQLEAKQKIIDQLPLDTRRNSEKAIEKLSPKNKEARWQSSVYTSENTVDIRKDDLVMDELKSVANEMKHLHRMKNKTKRQELDFRESSGKSRDSGIFALSQGVTSPDVDSDWRNSDSDEELSGDVRQNSRTVSSTTNSRISSRLSDSDSSVGELNQTILDPSSIRKISAAKLRRGKKVHAGLTSATDRKPPLHRNSIKSDIQYDSLIGGLNTMQEESLVPVM